MKEITKWCVENRISANPTKTKSMLFTTWQQWLSLPENQRNLSIVMNNDTLENVTSDKLLGVTIDHNLSWEKHITTIVSTINIKLVLHRRIKLCMPLSTRKLFFNTHILPSHWLLWNYLGQFTSYTEHVTNSKEGSSHDIRHNGYMPP